MTTTELIQAALALVALAVIAWLCWKGWQVLRFLVAVWRDEREAQRKEEAGG